MDKYQFLNDNLDRQLLWIARADSRLKFIVPMCLAMFGTLAAKSPELGCWEVKQAIPSFFAVLFLTLSLLFCFLATFPQTKGKKPSQIYFGGIIKTPLNDFPTKISETDEQDILTDLAFQCHINADIADKKFKWIQKAQFVLFIASLFWTCAIYFLWS